MASTAHDATAQSTTAAARSGLYRLLADAFAYPDAPLAEAVSSGAFAAELGSLASALPALEVAEDADAQARCADALRSLKRMEGDCGPERLAAQYAETFGHALSRDCPPYETEYAGADIFQQAQELADIGGFYRAFGLVVADTAHERLDHVSVELEFLHVLAAREAYALREGREEQRRICRDTQAQFLDEHLGRWAPYFALLVQRQSPGTFYHAVADVLAWFLLFETAHLGVCPERVSSVRQDDETPTASPDADAMPEDALWVGDMTR
jgi:DMSO reductase family type II enzyme chaperone